MYSFLTATQYKRIKPKTKKFWALFNIEHIIVFFFHLFACDPSQFPFGSCVFPHPQGLSALWILKTLGFYKVYIIKICIRFYNNNNNITMNYAFVFTSKDISIKSFINLSLIAASNFLDL